MRRCSASRLNRRPRPMPSAAKVVQSLRALSVAHDVLMRHDHNRCDAGEHKQRSQKCVFSEVDRTDRDCRIECGEQACDVIRSGKFGIQIHDAAETGRHHELNGRGEGVDH